MTSYAEQNKGFITQSMLKVANKCQKAYEITFIDPPDEDEEDMTTDAMIAGTAFDDFLSYGEKAFYDKWFILGKGERRTNKLTQLTQSQFKTIEAAINETKRQPLLDINGGYDAQSNITFVHRTFTLKAKPDRICFRREVIRDFKLVKDLETFEKYSIYDYDYIFQLAFYQLLVFKNTGKYFNCYLDVIDKTGNAASKVYQVPNQMLQDRYQEIFDSTDALIDSIIAGKFTHCQHRDYCTKDCRVYKKCKAGAIQRQVAVIQ